ncbi:transcriptional regulator [Mesorhizobium sp. Root157]|uniref:helix-turn-helix domain-containing protein n=1 Tax=Mesorhizobium sp. Root157 TaxID=1736477 RepID=UPI0006FCC991|nr:helix-turn-helix domain-containing protein [Mesorhizobium sp. Root157]KQZ96281.1 transcriptional regulator [Mesorhizobium sp. Root157]
MLAYSTPRSALPLQPSDALHPILSESFVPAKSQPCSFFPAGAEIYGQGEKAGKLYQVEFGSVRVSRLLADGRRQISTFLLAGEIFGFEADDTHHFSAEAICATGIRFFRLSTRADISRELLPLALRNLTRAQEHLLVLGRQNATERVAAFLVDMAERQGGLNQIALPMSRQDIGDYLGITIETVSRIFSKLRETGIIKLPSLRNIEIRKWDVLQRMSQ